MGRWLTWVSHQRLTGWACSQCGWTFPVPAMLTDQEAKSAYDRLAASKFQDHDCSVHGEPAVLVDSESFAARARSWSPADSNPKTPPRLLCRKLPSRTATIPTLQKGPRRMRKIFCAG